MFIDVTREASQKRVNESAAAVGAACAALWAGVCQQFSGGQMGNLAFKGSFVLAFGVVTYVMKDRLKEWARKVLHKKAAKWMPDLELKLFAGKEKIGSIREWFRFKTIDAIPAEIRQMRNDSCHSEIERGLPEDIFYFRKSQLTRSVPSHVPGSDGTQAWAIQDNVRINIERYLKHMADPFKELTYLDDSGTIRFCQSHRVYHFYLGLKSSLIPLGSNVPRGFIMRQESPKATAPKYRFYRIVLDKSGVNRVEDLGVEQPTTALTTEPPVYLN